MKIYFQKPNWLCCSLQSGLTCKCRHSWLIEMKRQPTFSNFPTASSFNACKKTLILLNLHPRFGIMENGNSFVAFDWLDTHTQSSFLVANKHEIDFVCYNSTLLAICCRMPRTPFYAHTSFTMSLHWNRCCWTHTHAVKRACLKNPNYIDRQQSVRVCATFWCVYLSPTFPPTMNVCISTLAKVKLKDR